MKKDLCRAWLGRICTELVEGLSMGFKLELATKVSKPIEMLLIVFRWQNMIFLYECKFMEAGMSSLEIPSPQTLFCLHVENGISSPENTPVHGSL
jgi:hypothetical protein